MLNTPVLGPIMGNKQQVTVYDQKNNVRRTIITSPVEAEAFIGMKNRETKKAVRKGCLQGLGIAAAGAAIGSVVALIAKPSLATKHFVNQLKIAKNSTKSYKDFAKLAGDHFGRYLKARSGSLSQGAVIGATFGTLFGMLKPAVNAQKVDNAITEMFIENNKR